MAYYRLSQVVKMRRTALGHDRDEYDADGPAGMTVYRMEEGKNKTTERTYRSLTRAMGMEESTRQGVLKTKNMKVLHFVNEISDAFMENDYEKVEWLIEKLGQDLDKGIVRNQQYLVSVVTKLNHIQNLITDEVYEQSIRENLAYGEMKVDDMLIRHWPFHEPECNILVTLVEIVRVQKNYEQQKFLLEKLEEILITGYMEQEYSLAYLVYVRWRMGDVLGNLEQHRMAIEMDEKTLKLCEEQDEFRYLAEVYYDIFWNYWMIKKKETLTEQEEARCKECLVKAYYISKAWFHSKSLYERRLRELYPEELD
ncbi:MAG: hypothetical protein J6J42_00830 [Lachnospiraceae bacterium]|nr:hypothetical protein [Lachnospiraceae bacterium]